MYKHVTCLLVVALSLFLLAAPSIHYRSITKLKNNLPNIDKNNFSFIVIGDSHNTSIFDKALKKIREIPNIAFLLHTGDLTLVNYTKNEKDFLKFKLRLRKYIPDMPVFCVMGNHDNEWTMRDYKKYYRENIGPTNFAVRVDELGLNIIGLDDSQYFLSKAQLGFLKRELARKYPLSFVMMHIPPVKFIKQGPLLKYGLKVGQNEFINLTSRYASMVFLGHLHTFDRTLVRGVEYLITGGANNIPERNDIINRARPHFIIVTVKNGEISYEFRRI